MKPFILTNLLLLIVFLNLFAGDPDRIDPNNRIRLYDQGFVLESLTGYGISSSTNFPIFNISTGNPASISAFNTFAVGFSNQFDSKVESFPIDDASFQRLNNFVPQSAGLIYPLQNLRIGAGFSQKYSGEIIFNKIEITTVNDPQGTGEFYTPSFKNAIHAASALASYQFQNLLLQTDQLSVGLQFNLNFLNAEQSIAHTTAKLNANHGNWKFGFTYNGGSEQMETFRLGLYFETGVKISGNVEFEGPELLTADPDSSMLGNNERITADLEPYPRYAEIPPQMVFGFLVRLSTKFALLGDLGYSWWGNLGEPYQNKLDFSNSLLFNLSENIGFSFGFAFLQDNSTSQFAGNLDAFYLSAGMIARLKMFELQFALADSHLSSAEDRRQTVGKLGIGFRL
jgi:hypothetical protein